MIGTSEKIYINSLRFLLLCFIGPNILAEHRTKEALQKLSDLYCFRCDTMIDGERCQDLKDNVTSFNVKCSNDQRTCKVKSISMSASTEDVTGRPKLWLLQRNCTKTCEPGCIVIGERTKLRSCTTCCENSYCNVGNGSGGSPRVDVVLKGVGIVLSFERFIKKWSVNFLL